MILTYRLLRRFVTFLAILVVLFLVAPILFVMVISLTDSSFAEFPPRGLSLRWYEDVVTDPQWTGAFMTSITVAVAASLLGTLMGLLAALAIVRARFRGKGLAFGIILAPMFMPGVISGVAIYFAFVRIVGAGSVPMIVLGHSIHALPLATIVLAAVLQGVDPRLEQAAASLGASPLVVLRRVTLPVILPGFISAMLLSFLTSFDEFFIALFYSTPLLRTLPIQIWSDLIQEVDPAVAAVSTLLVLLTIVVLALLLALIGARAVVNRGRVEAEA